MKHFRQVLTGGLTFPVAGRDDTPHSLHFFNTQLSIYLLSIKYVSTADPKSLDNWGTAFIQRYSRRELAQWLDSDADVDNTLVGTSVACCPPHLG